MADASVSLGLDPADLERGIERAVAKSMRGFRQMQQDAEKSAGGIQAALKQAFTIGAIASVAKEIYSVTAGYEQLEVAFTTMLGSGEKARDLMSQIATMGAETPFELSDLAAAGKSLLAFGVAGNEVAPTLRKIGDVSSAINAPIGEIAEIFGKAKVQGTLFAEDINQLTGRGIPIIQQFAKQLGVSDSEIKKMASDGKVTFPMLERAFTDLTSAGGQFYNMMAAQSETAAGKVSNLLDSWHELERALGKPLLPFLKNEIDGLGALIKLAEIAAGATPDQKEGEDLRKQALANLGMSDVRKSSIFSDPTDRKMDAMVNRPNYDEKALDQEITRLRREQSMKQAEQVRKDLADKEAKNKADAAATLRGADKKAAEKAGESSGKKRGDLEKDIAELREKSGFDSLGNEAKLQDLLQRRAALLKPAPSLGADGDLAMRSGIADPIADLEGQKKSLELDEEIRKVRKDITEDQGKKAAKDKDEAEEKARSLDSAKMENAVLQAQLDHHDSLAESLRTEAEFAERIRKAQDDGNSELAEALTHQKNLTAELRRQQKLTAAGDKTKLTLGDLASEGRGRDGNAARRAQKEEEHVRHAALRGDQSAAQQHQANAEKIKNGIGSLQEGEKDHGDFSDATGVQPKHSAPGAYDRSPKAYDRSPEAYTESAGERDRRQREEFFSKGRGEEIKAVPSGRPDAAEKSSDPVVSKLDEIKSAITSFDMGAGKKG